MGDRGFDGTGSMVLVGGGLLPFGRAIVRLVLGRYVGGSVGPTFRLALGVACLTPV